MNGFSDKQIVSMLASHSLWAKRACREILRRKEDFIPLLLAVLDDTLADINAALNDYPGTLFPAALLLAQMREKQAYPRLAALINFDDQTVDRLWGDALTQHYSVMLRDTFNGDTLALKPLIENRSAGVWSRAMAVSAWGMHYHDGYISREEAAAYFRRLIHEVYDGKLNHNEDVVLTNIATSIRENRLEELIEDVLPLYKRKGIDPDMCGSSKEYAEAFNDPLFAPDDQHIDNVVDELNTWKWFEEQYDDEEFDDEEFENDEDEEF
jgi:hypothetical protein